MKKIILGLALVGTGYLVISHAQDHEEEDTGSREQRPRHGAASENSTFPISGTTDTLDLAGAIDPITTEPVLAEVNEYLKNHANNPDKHFYIITHHKGTNSANEKLYTYYDAFGLNLWIKDRSRQTSPETREPINSQSYTAYQLKRENGTPVFEKVDLKTALPDLNPILPAHLGPILDLSDRRFNKDAVTELNKRNNAELAQITTLNLSNNHLTNIPPILRRMPNLETLLLDNNRITSLQGMPVLPNLEYLFLKDNHIASPQGMPELPTLEHLFLTGNQLTSLQGMPELRSLKGLFLSNNPNLPTMDIEGYQQGHPHVSIYTGT